MREGDSNPNRIDPLRAYETRNLPLIYPAINFILVERLGIEPSISGNSASDNIQSSYVPFVLDGGISRIRTELYLTWQVSNHT